MIATPKSTTDSQASFALLFDEIIEKLQSGEEVDFAAYVQQNPNHAERLQRLLPTVGMLAELGRSAVRQDGAEMVLAAPPGPEPGLLGDFRIVREVGRGGMGLVYEAEQVSLSRRVALKVLPFAATMDPRQLQRFQNEARAAAGLHHTNIVPVYFVGCERGVHYYAMQFIEGRDLASGLTQLRAQAGDKGADPKTAETVDVPAGQPAALAAAATQPIAGWSTERSTKSPEYFRAVARLGIEAAEALDYAHQMGIVHRDVKPANLLVDATGRLWVADFGLAHIQSDPRLTMTGDLVGTLRYMSPEQALAKRVVVDHRTDIYSLGATLYEMLTLEPTFAGRDRQELLRQIAFEEPRPPRRVNKAIPAELETIVLKALEKNPQDRYATAQELADDLRSWQQDRPLRARRPTLVQRARKWARRHRPVVWAATAVMLAVLLVSGTALWREEWQRAAVEHAVELALERADLLQEQERFEEVLGILTVAEGQLDMRGSAALRELVERRKHDVNMLMKLEEARLQVFSGGDKTAFDQAGADRLYAAAFEGYGLDVGALDPEAAARVVRGSAIVRQVTAGLDYWAFIRDCMAVRGGTRLRTVADLADDDPWRRRLRDADNRGDKALLELLAAEEATLSQPVIYQLLLAVGIFTADRAAAAERLLRQVQQMHPADPSINFGLGSILLLKKTPDGAEGVRFLQAAVALRPSSPSAYNNLSVGLKLQGRLVEAEAALRKAIALKPRYSSALTNLGIALCAQGKLKEAEAAYREVVRIKPDDPQAHNNLGAFLNDCLHLHKEAEIAFREAIRLQANFIEARGNLVIALLAQQRMDEVIAQAQEVIRLGLAQANVYNGLGNALFGKGRLDDAIAAYRKAIDLNPNEALVHNNLGNALRKQQKLPEAIIAHREAIRLKKEWPAAHNDLGVTLNAKGQLDEAIDAFREATRLKSDFALAYYNLGIVLQAKGKCEEAIGAYRKAIQIQHDYASAYNSLAWLLASCPDECFRDSKEAVQNARQATELMPANADYWSTLGTAHYRAESWQDCIAAIGKAMSLRKSGDGYDYFFLAMVEWKLNRLDEARKNYDRAIAWMGKNKIAPHEAAELGRLRAEAAALLGIEEDG